MKKTIALLCMAAGLLSCAKEIAPEESAAGVPVKFEISVAETKSALSIAKSDWETGDLIYVFIMGIPDKYVKLTRESDGSWSEETVGEAYTLIEFGGLDDHYELTAVHFPVSVDVAYVDEGSFDKNKFTFTRGGKPVFGTYYLSDQRAYTLDGTTVKASLQMKIPTDMVQLYFPGGEGVTTLADYTLASPLIQPVACASVGLNGTLQEDVFQPGARVGGGLPYEQGVIYAGRYFNPDKKSVHTFSLASEEKIWTFTVDRGTAGPLTEGNLYTFPNFPATGWNVELASDLYVDLGLPSGVKWAKYNLGASTETDYGNYFAWGEVTGQNEGKAAFGWSSYAWGAAKNSLIKYCSGSSFGKDGYSDALTILEKEDDAAYAVLGGKFRIPTKEDIHELLTLSKEWVEDYNGSGINGYMFTGNGNSIFLPAAGYWNETSFDFAGSFGLYWSSSLWTTDPNKASYLSFFYDDMSYTDYIDLDSGWRYGGFSVRPVSD